jgi:energy-coupling factor transport system permease protein
MGTRFAKFHPLVSFLFYAGAVMLLILMLHPVFQIVSFILILAINIIHDRLAGLRRWKYLLTITFIMMVLLNPLFNERGRHLLFMAGEHRITLEAVLYGGMNALSIIGIIAIFVSYNVIMTPNKLLYLFSKFLPQFAVLLMLTLRFIPLMNRRMEEITLVQKSKGISVTNGSWGTRVKTAFAYVQTLLTYSLEEAIQTADSMRARSYGNGPRTTYEYFRFRGKDFIAVAVLTVLITLIIYGRMSGYGVLTVYPMMEEWRFVPWDRAVMVFYCLYLSFPIYVEAGEAFRWRLSN